MLKHCLVASLKAASEVVGNAALAQVPDHLLHLWSKPPAAVAGACLWPHASNIRTGYCISAAWCDEPHLAQVFGRAFTLAGFSPWRLRLAEVYHMGPLGALTPARFGGVLRRYRRTHQRFGA